MKCLGIKLLVPNKRLFLVLRDPYSFCLKFNNNISVLVTDLKWGQSFEDLLTEWHGGNSGNVAVISFQLWTSSTKSTCYMEQ